MGITTTEQPTITTIATAAGTKYRKTEFNQSVIRKDGRPENQTPGDVIIQLPNGGILLDGAGGEGAGHDYLAAELAGEVMQQKLFEVSNELSDCPCNVGDIGAVSKGVVDAFRAGGRALRVAWDNGDINVGADTTANVVVMVNTKDGRKAVVANAGDSTSYLRNETTGEMTVISVEHSMVARMVRNGKLTPSEAMVHPDRNWIYNVVSYIKDDMTDEQVAKRIDLRVVDIPENCSIVVVSDGITDNMLPDHLNSVSARYLPPTYSADQFVQFLTETAKTISRSSSERAKPDDGCCFRIK